MKCAEFLELTSEAYAATLPYDILLCIGAILVTKRMFKWARNNEFVEEGKFFTWAGFAVALIVLTVFVSCTYSGFVKIYHPEQDSAAMHYCADNPPDFVQKSE